MIKQVFNYCMLKYSVGIFILTLFACSDGRPPAIKEKSPNIDKVNSLEILFAKDVNVKMDVYKLKDNPVISGRLPGEGNQFYPPSVIRVDSVFYAVAKGGGSELWGYYSNDGINWIPLPYRTSLKGVEKDHQCCVLRYDYKQKIFHLYTEKRNLDNDQGREIWHYYAKDFSGVWEQNKNNPVLDSKDFSAIVDSSTLKKYHTVIPNDFIIINDTLYMYGQLGNRGDDMSFFVASANSYYDKFAPQKNLLSPNDLYNADEGKCLQGINVIRLFDKFLFIYTQGFPKREVVKYNHRRILYTISESPFVIQHKNLKLLVPDSNLLWEKERNYAAQFLKIQDGSYLTPDLLDNNIWMYYSGSNHPGGINTGQTGLAILKVDKLIK